MFVFSGL